MLTHEIQVNEIKYSIVITDQIVNQVNNLKSLYNTAYEDPESFEQVSAQISSAIQDITSSVKPTANDNHLDGLIQEIIKIADNQAVQVEKQTKEKQTKEKPNKKVKPKK
jgi:organic radical activating enzyme